MGFAAVFLGAGIGGALRHAVNLGAARWLGTGFPYGTLTVNIVGSFVMGLFAGWFLVRTGVPQNMRLFFTTGLLGGFTTFSAFSLDAALLIERHAYWVAAAYVAGSVVASIAALFAGLIIFRAGAAVP